MKKVFVLSMAALFLTGIIFSASVFGGDINLAKKSTMSVLSPVTSRLK